MQYLIRRIEDVKFVSKPGSHHSYTNNIVDARKFDREEDAERDCCGNEYTITLEEAAKWPLQC